MAAYTSTQAEVSGRELEELSMQLRCISKNMRSFSFHIRSLYAENAVGTLSEAGVEFNELRDYIRNIATIYVNAVLPMSTKFVRMIRDFFSGYEAVEFVLWERGLDDELETLKGYRQFYGVLLIMHEKLATGLKTKEYQAKVLLRKLAATSKEFEMKIKEMNETASSKTKLEAIMSFIFPTVGPVIAGANQYEGSSAVAYQEEARLYSVASAVVSGTLIPALAAFFDALRGISAFFNVLENSLIVFLDEGLDAKGEIDTAKETERKARVKIHYRVMRSWAGMIKTNCDEFFAVLPDVRTDFAAISEEGTDTNYVQAWLEERKSDIRQQFGGQITELVKSGILDLKL